MDNRIKRIGIGSGLLIAAAAVIYLATLGCCGLISSYRKPAGWASFADRLGLSAAEREAVAPLEKEFLAKKLTSCDALCAKRAQLIQLLKQPDPDRTTLALIVDEIGQEQISLEKATLDHLLALRSKLGPAPAQALTDLVAEQLRTACEMTACGSTPGCSIRKKQD